MRDVVHRAVVDHVVREQVGAHAAAQREPSGASFAFERGVEPDVAEDRVEVGVLVVRDAGVAASMPVLLCRDVAIEPREVAELELLRLAARLAALRRIQPCACAVNASDSRSIRSPRWSCGCWNGVLLIEQEAGEVLAQPHRLRRSARAGGASV